MVFSDSFEVIIASYVYNSDYLQSVEVTSIMNSSNTDLLIRQELKFIKYMYISVLELYSI